MMTMLDVEEMNQQEGILLLLRRAKKLPLDAPLEQASSKDRAEAKTIVTMLDGLPLALDQAGAYIEETACSLSAYLTLYQNQKHRTVLLRQRGKLSSTHPEPVATTWSLSFLQVEQTNPAAADLLRLCAFFDPDAIPEEIISEGAPDLGPVLKPVAADLLQLNEAIGVLRKFSLIRRNADTSMLSVHRLVQAVLTDGMEESTQSLWAERAVRAVHDVFPDGTYETWGACQRYLPHAQVCTELISHHHMVFPKTAYLLHRLGRYFYETGRYDQVEALYQQALQIKQQALPANHPSIATTMHGLARLYQNQGNYQQAEALYQQALQIKQQALPANHPETAITLHALAVLRHNQGRYEQAEAFYQRALRIYEQALPADHPNTVKALEHYALLLRKMKRDEEAILLETRAKAIRDQRGK